MPNTQIPSTLIDFSVYKNGTDYLGASDIVLPNINAMTQTVSGAGIGGEIDMPILGAFQAMSVTLNWRTVTHEAVSLLAQSTVSLDFRGAQQIYDKTDGSLKSVGTKVTVKAIGKNGTLGNFQSGSTTGTSNELEVTYIKITQDGKDILEVDKMNYVFKVDGVDNLATVRQQLGM